MSKIARWFFSPSLAILLLLTFAGSMAIATFIENDFGTDTAWVLVYRSWWFELVMILLGFCFLGNIYKYRLWRKEKISILLFHIAFIVILIGAGITRYTAFGGVMRIREGAQSNTIISDRNFVQAHIRKGTKGIHLKKELNFSPLRKNRFKLETSFEGKPITIAFSEFIPDAVPEIVDDNDNGMPILELVVASGSGRQTIFLKHGEVQKIGRHQHKIALNGKDADAINIVTDGDQLKIRSPHLMDFFKMTSQEAGRIGVDSAYHLDLRTLYRSGDFSFVPLSYHRNGSIALKSSGENPRDNDDLKDDVLVVNLTVGGISKNVSLLYRKGFLAPGQSVKMQDLDITLSYGSVPIKVPFSLGLNDFELIRYPGSSSPSSYASEVTIFNQGVEIPYRIFMNNVLDYGGYRFFQASYDSDEKGTVLSVNHDRWGTWVSYLGYLLMGLGMFWTLFGKGSRFVLINKELKKLRLNKSVVALLLLWTILAFPVKANDGLQEHLAEKIANQRIDLKHAANFGRLMVQDLDGRIKPLNTLASEFLRKISRKPYFKYEAITLDANQTFLAIHADPGTWQNIPLIKINQKKGGKLFEGMKATRQGLVSFNMLLDNDGNYLLQEQVELANAKKPAERNEFDKEMLLVDERFNILFNIFSGHYLKIFPKRDDNTKTWYSHSHDFNDFPEEDAKFAQNILPIYFEDITRGRATDDWAEAESKLNYIKLYQDVLAKDIIPGETRVEAELLYNRLNLNFWLFQAFWTLGFLLLVIAVARIFSNRKWLLYSLNVGVILSLIAFITFGLNIILRWYVSQHAPWSNGYEMIVFVSWMLLLCGFLTHGKSDFALPLATLFSGTLLFVSYLDWLSPEITNLMPVLKSYWLKIHVATIVSSYAPLALSALLGLTALILMIFESGKRSAEITFRIKELTYINEISMTIGLFLLAVGTFLGGIWANESWGRYWAWDPKETWALISIIVYAAVLHLRFIPALRNAYTLNLASVFAFASIVMTSFGVNYYLSGLHSYAAGDPLPIPKFIYVVTAFVILIGIVAYAKTQKDKALS